MVSVIGEALIDLAPDPDSGGGAPRYRAHPGGSPFNVAVGLARLGQPTLLQARLADDSFGRQLRDHAAKNGVDLSAAVTASEPTTLAVVGLDADLNATYDFYVDGTADWQWSPDELATAPDPDWVHHGSLAAWTDPGAAVIAEHLTRLRNAGSCVISYDPNVRPALMGDRRHAVRRVEASVALSHVVKASAEDLAWLYPDQPAESAMASWMACGPAIVVLTDGARGARCVLPGGVVVSVPGRSIAVIDTVGAGDAFMSGLIDALLKAGAGDVLLGGSTGEALAVEAAELALRRAVAVSAITVSRPGADPPTHIELEAILG
jgi:fructokinase